MTVTFKKEVAFFLNLEEWVECEHSKGRKRLQTKLDAF